MNRSSTSGNLRSTKSYSWRYRPLVELLEARLVFASDFGDAPLPYKSLVVEGGAQYWPSRE